MPAAGLMISIGKSIPLINPDLAPLVTTGGVIENIGWAIIGNLHLLFALAMGGSWARTSRGHSLRGISFILDQSGSRRAIFGVTNEMLWQMRTRIYAHTLFGTKIMG